MDTTALQAFVTVAETRSFSLAAEQLFLTQPAISKRIAVLESELDIRLFDRIGRKISLTEAGRVLLPRAKHILLELIDSQRLISNLSGRVEGQLNLGTSHHIGLHRLPSALRNYTQRYPGVALDLRFMDSEAACTAVEKGDLELGIVTLPLNAIANLLLIPIWDDPLDIVVSLDHPLANKSALTPEFLAQYPAILPARGTYTREILEQAFAPLGIPLPVNLSTNYLETIKMMVGIGLGWSILPKTMLNDELQNLQIDGINLHRTLGIVRHQERTLSNAAAAMIAQLQEEAKEKLP